MCHDCQIIRVEQEGVRNSIISSSSEEQWDVSTLASQVTSLQGGQGIRARNCQIITSSISRSIWQVGSILLMSLHRIIPDLRKKFRSSNSGFFSFLFSPESLVFSSTLFSSRTLTVQVGNTCITYSPFILTFKIQSFNADSLSLNYFMDLFIDAILIQSPYL